MYMWLPDVLPVPSVPEPCRRQRKPWGCQRFWPRRGCSAPHRELEGLCSGNKDGLPWADDPLSWQSLGFLLPRAGDELWSLIWASRTEAWGVQCPLLPDRPPQAPSRASEGKALRTKAWENISLSAFYYLGHSLPFHEGEKGIKL